MYKFSLLFIPYLKYFTGFSDNSLTPEIQPYSGLLDRREHCSSCIWHSLNSYCHESATFHISLHIQIVFKYFSEQHHRSTNCNHRLLYQLACQHNFTEEISQAKTESYGQLNLNMREGKKKRVPPQKNPKKPLKLFLGSFMLMFQSLLC